MVLQLSGTLSSAKTMCCCEIGPLREKGFQCAVRPHFDERCRAGAIVLIDPCHRIGGKTSAGCDYEPAHHGRLPKSYPCKCGN